MFDKMMAKCEAVSIDPGGKKWIDGACALTDNDGDVIFSTFDTRPRQVAAENGLRHPYDHRGHR
jgi:hypothetical protein